MKKPPLAIKTAAIFVTILAVAGLSSFFHYKANVPKHLWLFLNTDFFAGLMAILAGSLVLTMPYFDSLIRKKEQDEIARRNEEDQRKYRESRKPTLIMQAITTLEAFEAILNKDFRDFEKMVYHHTKDNTDYTYIFFQEQSLYSSGLQDFFNYAQEYQIIFPELYYHFDELAKHMTAVSGIRSSIRHNVYGSQSGYMLSDPTEFYPNFFEDLESLGRQYEQAFALYHNALAAVQKEVHKNVL